MAGCTAMRGLVVLLSLSNGIAYSPLAGPLFTWEEIGAYENRSDVAGLVDEWVSRGAPWIPQFKAMLSDSAFFNVSYILVSPYANLYAQSDYACSPLPDSADHCRCWQWDVDVLRALILWQHEDVCGVPIFDDPNFDYNKFQFSCDEFHQSILSSWGECAAACPMPRALDYRARCLEHAYHPFINTYREYYVKAGSLQWVFLFCSLALIGGALFRLYFPVWLPYTTGVLIIFLSLGMLGQALMQGVDCPSRAFLYGGADHEVSRQEWDFFTGAATVPLSLCVRDRSKWLEGLMATSGVSLSGTDILKAGGNPTCGSDTDLSGCRWKWDDLYRPWRMTEMMAEQVWHMGKAAWEGDAGHGSGGGESHRSRRRAAGSGSTEVLTADDVWTFECNWLRDVIGVVDMDPHAFLVVFLPPLLFESSAFGVDMGIFRKQLPQIILMAFPAMVVASVITALLVWAAEPSFSLWACWLIGTIASATDPVAVVALLKDLGAPKELGTLIEGESLLNDGSAVVLFMWIRNTLGYDASIKTPDWMEQDFGERYIGIELARIVAQMLVLGLLIGQVFGWVTCKMLSRSFNDIFCESCILVAMPYFVFWLAELAMGSSAVLAVVVMGFYVNYHKSAISPRALHVMHEIYEVISHMMNTLVFTIAGAKLGCMLMDQSQFLTIDRPLLWVIYPIILFARGAAIAIHYPLLKRLGTGCDWKCAVVMWWGGLRGSVGLALALAVGHTVYSYEMWGGPALEDRDWKLPCRDIPQSVEMCTLMVVFFTVVINGMTMAPLMRLLKMTELPEHRKYMLRKAADRLRAETEETIAKIKQRHGFGQVNWGQVESSVWSGQYQEAEGSTARSCRLAVINVERASYEHAFTTGLINSEAFFHLEDFIAHVAADASQAATAAQVPEIYDKIFDKFGKQLEASIASPPWYERLLPRGVARSKEKSAALAYQVFYTYMHGIEQAEHAYKEEFTGDSAARFEYTDNEAVMKRVLSVLEQNCESHVAQAQTQLALRQLLTQQYACVEHMLHEGELLDLDAATLLQEINDLMRDATIRFKVRPQSRRSRVAPSRTSGSDSQQSASSLDNCAGGASPGVDA